MRRKNNFIPSIRHLLLISLILIHSSRTNNVHRVKNNSAVDSVLNGSDQRAPNYKILVNEEKSGFDQQNTEYQLVTSSFVIFSILSLIISTGSLIGIFSYFNNVPAVKSSILLSLYKDVVVIWILFNFYWFIRVVLCYNTCTGFGVDKLQAKILSFLGSSLGLILLIIKNIISIIRFYMMKTGTLDPPMPWGDDEKKGIWAIRGVCGALVIVYSSITYALGLYPKLYYLFINGLHSSSHDIPKSAYVYPSIFIFMLVTCASTLLGERIFRTSSNNIFDEKIIPRKLNYFIWSFLSVYGMFQVVDGLEIMDRVTRWKLFQFLFSAAIMTTPSIVILATEDMKAYVTRILKNLLDEIFLLSIYVVPSFLVLLVNTTLYLLYNHFEL